ncbi:cation diffusion facilitator CzcD-associated flavoprotein CzcO [Amycolatopsis bartoniae]|uniref:Oxidoreductase n=1 Tax=Amycolatopsis bartoniae TaxID=941986 RepID=A0A8H9IY71_9PSEU|nr:NAD(P)-binding domain-containing protein [Amycolatopsis bartoniae]MBB2934215.1 cation diffusion facilitator CzcD-associated flavoprotein CzcO [Amycolatopsis bartoniae]TVT08423.1 NAD(P)/FAD-dependent oxidoreductase [Amycolatopsis bartoniae]GHF49040.1 oxidoreductase [Amycolatopsis bartoniae]
MRNETDVVVIGAGQAGLSAAYHLRRTGFRNLTGFVVLDHGKRAGGAWQYRWPSLRLGKAHAIHDLPGMALGPADRNRPASDVVSEYFARYERTFDLPVLRPVDVLSVRDEGERLLVESATDAWAARAVINATGTWDRPFWPHYPGQETFGGRQLHTADFQSAEEFRGQHVVVVGGGASGVQLLLEIAEVASGTTWVTRREPEWFDSDFTPEHGRESVAKVDRRVREGLPPESVVSVTGLALTPEVKRGIEAGILDRKPMFSHLTEHGVVWADGTEQHADVILWATGFRAALDHLAPLHLRAPGGGIRMDGTRVVAEPRLQLVGYGPSASTIGANRAGRAAVNEVRKVLDSGAKRLR